MDLTKNIRACYAHVGGGNMEEKAKRKRYYNPEVAKRAQAKYDKKNTKGFYLKLNIKTDADILAKLEAISDGKQGYIKRLIREDIERGC